MPAVGSADGGNTGRGPVWVEGIAFGYFTAVIYVSYRRKVLAQYIFVYIIIGEVGPALAMGHPYAECRAFHSFKHQRGAFEDPYGGKTRFESARPVLNEPRLAFVRNSLPGYPPQQRGKLATVAY